MSGLLVAAFPKVGELMAQAYYDLYRAETAEKPAEIADLGPLDQLPRPWDPATITNPALRAEVWQWLDDVVGWINQEYVWETSDLIPPCWPAHPHLVHEVGVLADQRRRAGMAFTSDGLEEWHRYCFPAFLDRMKARSRGFCEDGHQPAPGTARTARYRTPAARDERVHRYAADIAAPQGVHVPAASPGVEKSKIQLFGGMLLNCETGEIMNETVAIDRSWRSDGDG